ncbi:hypothetical protein ACFWP3_37795 [Streptomyces sp. NPDC058525]|uniref:hypothetical protein n=1 Tax=Streptomyces sp. NPDC058525 TaxID=3346538 RepID=UPI0036692D20
MEERERALGLRERQPILVAPDGRVDPRLSECLRRSAFSAKAQGTQVTYAPLYRLFFTFLWQRGLDWDEASEDDVEDWEDWRRRRATSAGRGRTGHPPGQRCREGAGRVGLPGQPRPRRLPAGAGGRLGPQGRGWGSQDTYQTNAGALKLLFKDAASAEPPVAATGQVTVEWWKQWSGDIRVRRVLAAVIRRAPGVREATRVFMETPRRRPPARRGRPRKQAHTREELRRIRDAAAATVRAGRLRIAANTAVLQRWRAGAIERGDSDWPLGEVLDVLARTGDLPRHPTRADRAVTAYAERALGFEGNAASLARLFPTPAEIGAAAVLLIAHEAWNQSVLKKMDVPIWWPIADRDLTPPCTRSTRTRPGAGGAGMRATRSSTSARAPAAGPCGTCWS